MEKLAICPNCGKPFTGSRASQVFCGAPCRVDFYDVQAVRGKLSTPFLQTWRRGKHGSSGASTYAFAQLCALADKWNAEDREAGRDPSLIVVQKQAAQWRAADLS